MLNIMPQQYMDTTLHAAAAAAAAVAGAAAAIMQVLHIMAL
jgi:hypothetical protein